MKRIFFWRLLMVDIADNVIALQASVAALTTQVTALTTAVAAIPTTSVPATVDFTPVLTAIAGVAAQLNPTS